METTAVMRMVVTEYLDNELTIVGPSSFGGEVSHLFDASSICPIESNFVLQLHTILNLLPSHGNFFMFYQTLPEASHP